MTIDTNILIAYLDGEEAVVDFINTLITQGKLLYLPATVEIELLSFAGWTPAEVTAVEQFLSKGFVFMPIDRQLAQMTAHIRRTVKIKTPDATIAATAISTDTPLLTRNTRDFKNIPGLSLMSIV